MASVISGSLNMSIDVQSTTLDVNGRNWTLELLKRMVPWAPSAIVQVIGDTIAVPAASAVTRTLTGASGGVWPARALADPADPTMVGKKIIAYAVKNGHATDTLTITWVMGTLIVPAGQQVMAYRPLGVTVPMAPANVVLTHSGGTTDMLVDLVVVYQ